MTNAGKHQHDHENAPSLVMATIRARDGEFAMVEVAQGGCGRCHEKGGCGGQNISQMLCTTPKTYRVRNSLAAGVGERVMVAVRHGSVRRIANIVYVFPLLAAIVLAALGHQWFGEPGAMMGAVLGLGGAFAFISRRSAEYLAGADLTPSIISRVSEQ